MVNDLLTMIADNLDSCNREAIQEVKGIVGEAFKKGFTVEEILDNGLLAGLTRVGEKFKTGELFIPEVLVVARAIHEAMDVLRPHMIQGNVKNRGRMAIGTVQGALHDIGKNLVGIMVESAGLEVIDLGINIPAERFVEAVQEHSPDILGLSALLTTTMGEMKYVIESVKEAGLKTKIIIGGAPITQRFADDIGADAYAPDAGAALDKLKELLGSN